MDTYATAGYLRGLLNSGQDFTLHVWSRGEEGQYTLHLHNVDDLGLRGSTPLHRSIIIPWTAIENVQVVMSD